MAVIKVKSTEFYNINFHLGIPTIYETENLQKIFLDAIVVFVIFMFTKSSAYNIISLSCM